MDERNPYRKDMNPIFSAASSLRDRTGLSSVGRALSDLERDFRAILPDTPGKPLTVRINASLREDERK